MTDVIRIKDRYGDDVEVEIDMGYGIVYLTVNAGDKSTDASLTGDMAREVGLAMIRASIKVEGMNPSEPS